VLVTDDELKEKPFKRIFLQPADPPSERGERVDRERERERERDNSKKSKSKKRDREEERHQQRRGDEDGNKKQKADPHNGRTEAASSSVSTSASSSSKSWLHTGIRVKIISKKIDDHGRHYLSKGTVLDVYFPSGPSSSSSSSTSSKVASIRLDSGVVLQEIKEKYLETVLPKSVGDSCLILTGEHRGETATLLEKDYDRNEVTIQLTEEMEIVLLAMDSVAALA
jgi:hypothetical protein